jgi:hypothetical protein
LKRPYCTKTGLSKNCESVMCKKKKKISANFFNCFCPNQSPCPQDFGADPPLILISRNRIALTIWLLTSKISSNLKLIFQIARMFFSLIDPRKYTQLFALNFFYSHFRRRSHYPIESFIESCMALNNSNIFPSPYYKIHYQTVYFL